MQEPTDIFQSTSCLTDGQLLRYVKQEVSAAEKRMIELHLADCEMCSDALEGLSAAEVDLTNVQKELHEKIDARTKKQAKVIPLQRRWYMSAAAAVVLLALTFAVLNKYVNKTQTATEVSENKAAIKLDSVISNEKNSEQEQASSKAIDSPNFKESPQQQNQIKNVEQKMESEDSQADESMPTEGDVKTVEMESVAIREDYNKKPVTTDLAKANHKYVADSVTVTGNTSQGAVAIKADKDIPAAKAEEVATYSLNEVVMEKKSKSVKAVTTVPSKNGFADSKAPVIIDETKYNQAISLYNKQDYKNALPLFLQIISQSPGHIECNYFAGMCYYNLNNYNNAITYLNTTSKNKLSNYYEPALWYKSQSLIKLKENKKAVKVLQEIVKLNGNYKKQAEEILTELK